MELVIGIDVGATWTRIALAREDGSILFREVIKTPKEGDRYTVANAIAGVIEKRFSSYLDKIKAIGIGSIGPLDLSKGMVTYAPNLPIHTFELARPLQEKFEKPVYMANDCVAAVWGEKLFGAGRGHSNIVYVTLSTGIGGGVIVNDTLLLGKKGNAHEIGHIVVDIERKMPCGCGGYGHWEAYAGGANIPRFAKFLIETWSLSEEEKRSPIYEAYRSGTLTTEAIYTYAKKGDRLARRIVEEINRYNIAGIESVINIYDPEILTIGGSIALKNIELVVEPIAKAIASSRGLLTEAPKIMPTPLGDDAVLVGAIAIAIEPPRNLVSMLRYLEEL